MNYNKLVFHEDTWPDVVGRTLTFNCKRYELELKTIEGIRSCSITMAECIAFRSRFELSHIDTWAAEYHPSFGAIVLDGNSWYLKLYNGRKLFKERSVDSGDRPESADFFVWWGWSRRRTVIIGGGKNCLIFFRISLELTESWCYNRA